MSLHFLQNHALQVPGRARGKRHDVGHVSQPQLPVAVVPQKRPQRFPSHLVPERAVDLQERHQQRIGPGEMSVLPNLLRRLQFQARQDGDAQGAARALHARVAVRFDPDIDLFLGDPRGSTRRQERPFRRGFV